MGSKQHYTAKEYFKLFDDMNRKVKNIKDEKSIMEAELNDRIQHLESELKAEKSKCEILQKRILKATSDCLELIKTIDNL
jgi:hypothetical protein